MSSFTHPVNLPAGSGVILTGPGVYRGFSIRETAGAAAVLQLRDAITGSTGVLLEEISLASLESARENYVNGVEVKVGVYANLISGTMPTGSVRVG